VGRIAGAFEVERVGATLVLTPLVDLTEPHHPAAGSGAARVLALLADPSVCDVRVDLHRATYSAAPPAPRRTDPPGLSGTARLG
jgi:hypothetical protein